MKYVYNGKQCVLFVGVKDVKGNPLVVEPGGTYEIDYPPTEDFTESSNQ